MTQYFLHLRDHVDEILDPEGKDYASVDALKKSVLSGARELLAEDMKSGMLDLRYRIDAENSDGQVVYTLPFKHAFAIIPEAIVPDSATPA
jgi:hypothetical protein